MGPNRQTPSPCSKLFSKHFLIYLPESMKKLLLAILLTTSVTSVFPQGTIDPSKIDIVRDSFGVPHIFAKTDREVAYGLAYAHAEDNFETIQKGFLASRSMLGMTTG